MDCNCDLLFVGGGAGGIGAATAAAAHGASAVLLEQAPEVGGTAGRSGVCHWESGIGAKGVPIDIYRHLRALEPQAVGIYGLGRHCCAPDPKWREFPGGEHPIVTGRTYADTLRGYGGADSKTPTSCTGRSVSESVSRPKPMPRPAAACWWNAASRSAPTPQSPASRLPAAPFAVSAPFNGNLIRARCTR